MTPSTAVLPGEIPAAFVHEIVDREPGPGRAWLQTLPELATEFLRRWDCVRDGSVRHGAVALVLPVRRADQRAVIKISFPHPGNRSEPFALAAWSGRGAVELLQRDDAQFAMLLERAGQLTLASVTDNEEALRTAGALAHLLAVPAPATLPKLSDTIGWEEQLLEQDRALGHLLPRPVLNRALAVIRDLRHDHTDTMIHGDLHYANVLRATRDGADNAWLAIDPKGFAGSAAFDAATLVWERLDELHPTRFGVSVRRRLSIFAEAAGVDPVLARDCTFARTVSTYQYETLHGRHDRAASVKRLIDDGLS